MEERRELERFDLRLPAKVDVLNNSMEGVRKTFDLSTRDISAGGAFFPTPDPPPLCTQVDVKITLRLEKLFDGSAYPELKARGSVVRVEPAGMAVRFDSRPAFIAAQENSARA
jgi:hypothetical protein